MQRAPAWAGECRAQRPQPRDRAVEHGQAGSTSLNQAQAERTRLWIARHLGTGPGPPVQVAASSPSGPPPLPPHGLPHPEPRTRPPAPSTRSWVQPLCPAFTQTATDHGTSEQELRAGATPAATCDRSCCRFPGGTHEMETGGMQFRDVLGLNIHNQGRRRSRPGAKVRAPQKAREWGRPQELSGVG